MSSETDKTHEVNEYYRRVLDGHVFIRETMEALLDATDKRIRELGRRPRILELGSHAGVFTERLLARWPDAEIVVQDENAAFLDIARSRLAGRDVQFHFGPPETLAEPVDIVISIARHHHLPHDYLSHLKGAIRPGGVYLVAEELCPEYCEGEHQKRIDGAELLHIVGGYVLTSKEDVAHYEARGDMPPHAKELEQLRRRALWRWYRYVVDYAVERGYYDIAVEELRATHDDLITGSDAEHKFSPRVVERQFALAGFKHLSRRMIGPEDAPELQSLVVFEFAA